MLKMFVDPKQKVINKKKTIQIIRKTDQRFFFHFEIFRKVGRFFRIKIFPLKFFFGKIITAKCFCSKIIE